MPPGNKSARIALHGSFVVRGVSKCSWRIGRHILTCALWLHHVVLLQVAQILQHNLVQHLPYSWSDKFFLCFRGMIGVLGCGRILLLHLIAKVDYMRTAAAALLSTPSAWQLVAVVFKPR